MSKAKDQCVGDCRIPTEFQSKSGIYQWEVPGVGSYIGKSKNLKSRTAEYRNNVRKLMAGAPYRKGKPTSFRHVHHAMASAVAAGHIVQCRVIEECEPALLNERERYWIAELGILNGPSREQKSKAVAATAQSALARAISQ